MGNLFTTTSMRRRLGALLLAVGLVQAAAAQSGGGSAPGVIVKFKDGTIATAASGLESPQAVAAAQREKVQSVLARAGVENLAAVRTSTTGRDWQRVDFGRELKADEAQQYADRLSAQPEVAWAVPNTREKRLAVAAPNDPEYVDQWWLQAVSGSNGNVLAERRRGVPNLFTGWQRSETSSVVVAVLDTGITSHRDLASDRILAGYDFVSDAVYANDGNGRDSDPSDPGDWVSQEDKDDDDQDNFTNCDIEDSSWHGTIISGIIAAETNNGQGVAGSNWGARILPVRVAGKCGALVSDIVDGMRWAAGLSVSGVSRNRNPARVLNISFGSSASCNSAYREAIADVREAGAVIVAAAGNERGGVSRPANCDNVIAVGAANRDGFKSTYSNFGSQVALMTVGGDQTSAGAWGDLLGDDGLLTLTNGGTQEPDDESSYAFVFGTSFSAPIVSATVSLMLGIDGDLGPDDIVQGLRQSARPHVVSDRIRACSDDNPGRCICTTETCGAGLLDVDQALAFAEASAAGNPYTPPTVSAANVDSDDVIAATRADCQDVGSCSGGGGGGDDDDDEKFGSGAITSAGWLLGLMAAVGAAAVRRRRPGDRSAG